MSAAPLNPRKTTPIITLQGLTVDHGRKRVIQPLDLTLDRPQLIALVGPNGAGKSTLLQAIARLLPARAGQITFNGQDYSSKPAHQLASLVGYLPQQPPAHWPVSAATIVGLGLGVQISPFHPAPPTANSRIMASLAEVGLAEKANQPITQLSGGEQARVHLARLLVADPAILLADEPVAALDPYHQLAILELFARRAAGGKLAIMVLHDLALASRYADRILLLHAGALVADGSPAAVFTDHNLQRYYGITGRRDSSGSLIGFQTA